MHDYELNPREFLIWNSYGTQSFPLSDVLMTGLKFVGFDHGNTHVFLTVIFLMPPHGNSGDPEAIRQFKRAWHDHTGSVSAPNIRNDGVASVNALDMPMVPSISTRLPADFWSNPKYHEAREIHREKTIRKSEVKESKKNCTSPPSHALLSICRYISC